MMTFQTFLHADTDKRKLTVKEKKRTRSGSIKNKLTFSFMLIIVIMIIPTVYSISVTRQHTQRYDQIITNVSRANRINQIVKVDISNEIWEIVAGFKEFQDGKQYEILDTITTGFTEMMESTEVEENRNLIEVAFRAESTLQKYVDMLGTQISMNAPVSENEQILEEVRGCASLLNDILQDFIVAEIETAAATNESIKQATRNLTIIQVIIACIVVIVAITSLASVTRNIRKPIQDMEELSNRIAIGDLEARAELPHVEELDHLTENLNIMAGKIKELLEENIREQQNLQKAEMKTLQAQITPHFLYNTFDTIIWLAESGQTDQVIEITRAFSSFFRISLSKGHEWIPIEQELDHVRHYLTIQGIRYRDILDYTIEFDESLTGRKVLKLMLQPLVENAIYHGIKNKRGRGVLKVIVKADDDRILFSVEDNGLGFTPERLAEVQAELNRNDDAEKLTAVYGLYNVNKRLKLYYDDTVKLNIETEYKKGTKVSFAVPIKSGMTGENLV